MFNALASLDLVVGAEVADLYAGSGALGLEALSRGAERCTFVERDRAALSAIHDNIARLGLLGRTRVVAGDAITMLPKVSSDLAFADPPYGFDRWAQLQTVLDAAFLVAEAAVEVQAADGWEQRRVKRYGRTWVTFLARS